MAMTLDKSIEVMDTLLGTQGYCTYGQAEAWSLIRAHLSAQAKVLDEAGERIAFEHAERASELTRDDEGDEGDYRNPFVQSAWEGWIARASIEAARLSQGAQNNVSDNNERMCCSGAECGCQGVTKGQWRAHLLAKQLSHGDAVGDVYWEHADGESEMRVNWFGDPPPIGTMLYTHPAERAAVPDVVFQNLAQIADGGELSRSDMQDMASEAYNLLRRSLTAAPQPPEGARVVDDLPLTEALRDILGRPCFTLIGLANVLRKGGYEIRKKAEDEQAVCLHWMLTHYLKHGDDWMVAGNAELESIRAAAPTLAGKEGAK